jgi:hypothetical protein
MPKRAHTKYSNKKPVLTLAAKMAIIGLVRMGKTPSQACKDLQIPIHTYSYYLLSDKAFSGALRDAMRGIMQCCMDRMIEIGLAGDPRALEASLVAMTRQLPKDDPMRYIPPSQIQPDDDNTNEAMKDYMKKWKEFQMERLKDQLPKGDAASVEQTGSPAED